MVCQTRPCWIVGSGDGGAQPSSALAVEDDALAVQADLFDGAAEMVGAKRGGRTVALHLLDGKDRGGDDDLLDIGTVQAACLADDLAKVDVVARGEFTQHHAAALV